ncbi:MAG: nitrilase [Deltaproteobacteria bacterium]|nr:MAG: nitrilase [Deltaproteobacteria bacterium]
MKDIRIATAIIPCPVGDINTNLKRMGRWIKTARQAGASLVCFPELNITGYTTRPDLRSAARPLAGYIHDRLVDMAQMADVVILAGMAEIDPDRRLYATHLVVLPDGDIHSYRKLHLAPPEQPLLAPGNRIPLFSAAGITFGIQLCYDAHFPELSTKMALAGADVIFVPHASPRVTPREKLASWMRHLPARAYDNSVFVIAVNPCGENGLGLSFAGLSVAIGPSGKVIDRYLDGREGIMVVDLAAADLSAVREHRMRFFLPNRRPEIYQAGAS